MRWAFDQDDPDQIVQESLAAHGKHFVHQVVAGGAAKDQRAVEAATVKHCALSLVGEPVLYPRVGELLSSLHSRRVSTFLVTNGQFPEQLQGLPRVTQLYVSVDAPNEQELIRVGRPLFKDAWDRLKLSLDALRRHGEKGCRTVCRLTLRKGALSQEAARGYAELISIAKPDFVEAKGVTPVPLFKKAGVLMEDIVPTHSEVRDFGELLQQEIATLNGMKNVDDICVDSYGFASEHRHSCAVLLARQKWRSADGQGWRTWINFDSFFDSLELPDSEAVKHLYAESTPEWALWNSPEAGFDPKDVQRVALRSRPDDFVDLALRPLRRQRAKSENSASGD